LLLEISGFGVSAGTDCRRSVVRLAQLAIWENKIIEIIILFGFPDAALSQKIVEDLMNFSVFFRGAQTYLTVNKSRTRRCCCRFPFPFR
jgi:hypothetical protein